MINLVHLLNAAPIAPAIPRTNLMLHCGANRVERSDVFAVPTPEPTDTWHPLPHLTLLNTVETALVDAGHRIIQSEHALTRDGLRYFGVVQVARVNAGGDVTFVVGIRNLARQEPAGRASSPARRSSSATTSRSAAKFRFTASTRSSSATN